VDINAWDHHAVVIGWGANEQLSLDRLHHSPMSDTQLVAVLAALGHGIRLNLWRMLLPFGARGLPAGTIAVQMSIVPSSLSFHLRQMTQAGVLMQRRSSRQIIYAVNQDIIDGLVARLVSSNPSCDRSSVSVATSSASDSARATVSAAGAGGLISPVRSNLASTEAFAPESLS
jgi:ArsR family transcriptional regulator